MKNEFLVALTQLAAEKNLPKEVVLEAVEAALLSAYKKDNPNASQNVSVKISRTTGEVKFLATKNVVEKAEDPEKQIPLGNASKLKNSAALGDTVEVEITPPNAGRIAAQTAKQVVMQRLREAEREVVFEEFADKEGDVVSGIVQRMDPKQITIDLGRAEAVLPPSEQVKSEHYRIGQRLKLYLMEVRRTSKGPQVIVSRTHRNLLRRLFEREVPEMLSGTVELKSIAREAGYRSKVAVYAHQDGVDAVGCCVGLRGIRIQNIVNELGGERIDVIQWHPDPKTYVANALSPAQVMSVEIDDKEKTAQVVVPDRQLSLAIGKEGQNARLAAKLTGLRIDIKSASVAEAEKAEEAAAKQAEEAAALAEQAETEPLSIVGVPTEPEPEVVPPAEVAIVAEVEEVPGVPPEEPELPVPEPVEVEEGEPLVAVGAVQTEAFPLAETEATVPQERPQIRFAEDILAPEAIKPSTKGKKGKRDKKGSSGMQERESEGKPKKKVRRPSFYAADEDEEEYVYLKKPGRRE